MMSRFPGVPAATVLIRVACFLGLASLLLMVIGILFPLALPVIASMSIGQGLGSLAFICYLLAIVAEIAAHEAARRKLARASEGGRSGHPSQGPR